MPTIGRLDSHNTWISFWGALQVERKTGDGAVRFHVPTTRRHVLVAFDVGSQFSGVDGVVSTGANYKHTIHRNSPLFQQGISRTVDIVRSVGELVIYIDGVKFTSWHDNEGSIPSGNGLIGGERNLILAALENNIVEYQKVELLPGVLDQDIAPSSTNVGGTTPARAVVPPENALTTAEATVRDVFADEYASAKKPAERTDLATKLLKVGLETTDDLASRFVTIRSARNVAVKGGNVDLAFRALGSLSESFDLDVLAEQVGLVVDFSKVVLTDEESTKLKSRIAQLRRWAFSEDRYPLAITLNQTAKNLDQVGG